MKPTEAQRKAFMERAGLRDEDRVMPTVSFPTPERALRARERAAVTQSQGPPPPTHPEPLEPFEGYRKFNLTLTIAEPGDRDKFNSLSRPETFREIRPGREPGQRGAYSVEMNYEEYAQALQDMEDPSSNLIVIEPDTPKHRHAVPSIDNLQYLNAYDTDYDGTGARIGILDDGLTAPVASIFSDQIIAANDVTGDDSALTAPGSTCDHGSFIAGLAVPPGAQVAIAKAYENDGDGLDSDHVAALYWLVDGVSGLHVVNISSGSPSPSTIESDAIAHALSQGVVICASAGNEGTNNTQYPADYSGVLKITNYDHRTDSISPSSSYGGTVFGATSGMAVTSWSETGTQEYTEDGGTSGSTAFATRLVALEVSSGKTSAEAKAALAANARSTGASASYEGNGVLQLSSPPAPPPEPEPPPPPIPPPEGTPGGGMGPPQPDTPPDADPDTGEIPPKPDTIIKTPPGQGITKVNFPFFLSDDGTVWTLHPYAEQIGEGFVDISLSFDGFLGIKSDGSAWQWGNNDYFNDLPPENTLTFEGGGPSGDDFAPFFNRVTNLPAADRFTDSGSGSRTMIIGTDGKLWAWGSKSAFLFDSTNLTNTFIPPQNVRGLTNVKDAYSDLSGHYVLFNDGTMQAWGHGLQIGFPIPIIDRTAPVAMSISDVAQFSINQPNDATYATAAFLKENGDIWHASAINTSPAHVPSFSSESPPNATQVSASRDQICAITLDHQLWSRNYRDSIFGAITDPGGWEQEPEYDDWASVRVHPYPSAEFYATQCDCSLWRLGYETTEAYYLETHIINRMNRVAADELLEPFFAANLSANDTFVLAKQPSGEVYAWGDNSYGQLDLDEHSFIASQASRASELDGSVQMVAGGKITVIRKSDGSVWSVGDNEYGQLGTGDLESSETLVEVLYDDNSENQYMPMPQTVVKVAASGNRTFAITDDGYLWGWGESDQGYLGTGFEEIPHQRGEVPNRVVRQPATPTEINNPIEDFRPLENITDVWANFECSWAKDSSGEIWMWGNECVLKESDTSGGVQVVSASTSPVPLSEFPDNPIGSVAQVDFGGSHGIVLQSDGTLMGFAGANHSGAIGTGSADVGDTEVVTPKAVPGVSGVTQVACGNAHSVILLSDGTVWSAGANDLGQLGDGTDADYGSEFGQVVGENGVGFLQNIVQVECSNVNSYAIDSSDVVWAWGGTQGLGDPHATQSSNTPVRCSTRGALVQLTICEDTEAYCPPDQIIPGGGGGDTPGDSEPAPPALPPFEPDPIIAEPDFGKINLEPEKFPDIDIGLPEFPPGAQPGDPIIFQPPNPPGTPPGTPLPPAVPGTIGQVMQPSPPMDPCNIGMPSPGGGACGPGNIADTPMGQAPGRPPSGGGFPSFPPPGGVIVHAPGTSPGGTGSGKYFPADKCYKDELVNVIILQLATMLALDPDKVQVNPDCDERYTGCFKKGTNIFDALKKMAALCGGVFNPGDGGGEVVTPVPTDVHHTLNEYENIFYLERMYNNSDNFALVEVYRPSRVVNGVVYPAVAKDAPVSTPFEPALDSVKVVYTYDYNLTPNQIQNMANVEAAKTSGNGAKVQVTTLYDPNFKFYDHLHLQRPSLDWYTDWMIRTIEHTFATSGLLTVLEATYLSNEGGAAFTQMDDVIVNPVFAGLVRAA